MGAFGPGISWPAFYTQNGGDASWSGGPNISIAGFSYGDGAGINGDGRADAILLGGTTLPGGSIRLLDDSSAENSPRQWSLEATADGRLENNALYICPLEHQRFDAPISGTRSIDVPSFCRDGVCGILWETDATFGAFGPGLSWPIYYKERSTDQSWVGGPNVCLGGVCYGGSGGVNGDGNATAIVIGGETVGGGQVSLYDDLGSENHAFRWTISIQPDAEFTRASFYVYRLSCAEHPVPGPGATSVDVPSYCQDALCTVLLQTDTTMGAFGPGFSWPAYVRQNTADGSWIGGPALNIAGWSYSAGRGFNGDSQDEYIFGGSQTAGEGRISLYDDYGLERSSDQWAILFEPDDELTAASFHFCAGICARYGITLPVSRVFLPALTKE
jgi:hypothetical protein